MNKELYNVYLERRKAGYSSKDAVTSARYELTQRAKVALRGWDFDGELVLICAAEAFKRTYEVSDGRYTVVVFGALDWVEKCLNGDVYYVGLEVRIYEAGADTEGDDCLAEASLWGVEATPEYVGEVLNELFDEAMDSLTS